MDNKEEGSALEQDEMTQDPVAENSNDELANLRAENEKLQALLGETSAEAKKYRQQKSEARRKAEEVMSENGEFKALAESYAERIERLEQERADLAKKAEAFDADAAARQAALQEKIKSLSSEDQQIVMAGASLAQQEMIARRFLNLHPGTTVNTSAKVSTNAPVAKSVDANDLSALTELLRTDRAAYDKLMQQYRGSGESKKGTFAKIFNRN